MKKLFAYLFELIFDVVVAVADLMFALLSHFVSMVLPLLIALVLAWFTLPIIFGAPETQNSATDLPKQLDLLEELLRRAEFTTAEIDRQIQSRQIEVAKLEEASRQYKDIIQIGNGTLEMIAARNKEKMDEGQFVASSLDLLKDLALIVVGFLFSKYADAWLARRKARQEVAKTAAA